MKHTQNLFMAMINESKPANKTEAMSIQMVQEFKS
jgi:hypothetical protein